MKITNKIISCLLVGIAIYLGASNRVVAQYSSNEKVYTVAERQPEFPGGQTALSQYLAENIKVPNSFAKNSHNAGSISAKFIIDKLGYIHDIRISTKPLDKKAKKGMEALMTNIITAVEKMPRWEPGEVGGQRVAVFYTLPIEVSM